MALLCLAFLVKWICCCCRRRSKTEVTGWMTEQKEVRISGKMEHQKNMW